MKRFLLYITLIALGIAACQDVPSSPSNFIQGSMTIEDRKEHSVYDWSDTRAVELQISTPSDGPIKLRAVNGEILFHGYLVNGVLSGLVLNLPHEIEAIFLEFEDEIQSLRIEGNRVVYLAEER